MTDAAFLPEDLLAHAGFVRALARSLLADEHAAEDVAQEAARVALERPPRPGALRPWLATIARNFALRKKRSESRRELREKAAARPEALPAADSILERAETLQRVIDAVGALPESQQVCILLRFYEGLAPREIAKRLEIPVETVHTRLRRALATLRERLARAFGSHERDWRAALLPIVGGSALSSSSTGALLGLKLLAGAAAIVAAVGVWRGIAALVPPASAPLAPVAGAALTASPLTASDLLAGSELTGRIPSPSRALLGSSAAISGCVRDENGEGIEGLTVYVLGEQDPFGKNHPAPRIQADAFFGRQFPTDAQGRWSAELPAAMRVFVVLECGVRFKPVPGSLTRRWIDAPAEDVDFLVQAVPAATLEVRAIHGGSRRALSDFHVKVHGDRGSRCEHVGGRGHFQLGFCTAKAEGEVARIDVAVFEGASLNVALFDSSFDVVQEQQLELHAGETREILFVLTESGIVSGFAVDSAGAPIAEALVFFGDATTGRGDEPFRPFRAERIAGGVRTAADGWFELEGSGPLVSAWHPDFSQATLPTGTAGRIVLAPRGAIHGRVVDETGQALPGTVVKLDDRESGPELAADEKGAFAFEHLEAGAHGFFVERKLRACVRLQAGETAELELVLASGALVLELFSGGEIVEVPELHSLLVGLDPLFELHELEHQPDPSSGASLSEVTIPERVRSGRYLLVSVQGWTAPLEVSGERAFVELGSAELVVHTQPGRRLQAVPADADPFVRLIAARLPACADEDGLARFHLHPGRYVLVGEAGVVQAEVDVPAAGTGVEL